MGPPDAPITKVLAGDFSTEGIMEDGGRSPESGGKGKSSEINQRSEIKVRLVVKEIFLVAVTRKNVLDASAEVDQLVVEDDSGSRRKNC